MRKSGSTFKCFVAGFAIVRLLSALPSAAQQSATMPPPAFDVVSVKRVAGSTPIAVAPGNTAIRINTRPCQYLPDRVLCQNTPLNLTKEAYQVDYIQLDAPKWMGDVDYVFALQATMPTGTTKETARLMLRQALAERLGLKVHWEKRNVPVYALVPGKHGVKLQPADDPVNPKPKSVETPMGKMNVSSHSGRGEYMAVASTLDQLASNMWFGGHLDRPVVNMTGLTGKYKIDLHWMPAEEPAEPGGVRTSNDPGFVTAVQEQLGLRMEKRTLPYDVLVVDHCEQTPTAN